MCLSLFSQPAFSTFLALYRHELIEVHTSNVRHLYPHCTAGALEVSWPRQKAAEDLHQSCSRPTLSVQSSLSVNSKSNSSFDFISLKMEIRGRTVGKVTSWVIEGVSALLSLVTAACTYRQGLKSCSSASSTSSRLWEVAAVWRDTSRSRESSEQHK